MDSMKQISMIKIVKEHIGFHYLLTKITAVYFDSYGTEYTPQEVLNKMKYKSITHKVSKI